MKTGNCFLDTILKLHLQPLRKYDKGYTVDKKFRIFDEEFEEDGFTFLCSLNDLQEGIGKKYLS